MRRAWIFLVLAACGGPSKPPPAIGNQTAAAAAQAPTANAKPRIVGRITSTTGAPLAGVTVVFMPATLDARGGDDLVTITKADGSYSYELAQDTYELTFYYADMTWRRHGIVVTGTTTVDQQFDENNSATSGEIQECFSALASSCHVIH